MKPEVTQTNYLYTWRTIECFHSIGPHADGIGPALSRQSVLQVCPPVSWLPSKQNILYNIYTMLDQRRRRWADVV